VDVVVLIDKDPAGPAELLPLREEFSILVENLDTVVGAIAYEDPSFRIHGDSVWSIKLAGAGSFLSPGLDEGSIFGEPHDAGVAVAAVSVGDKDIAIGSHKHVGRLVEGVVALTGNSGLTQGQQNPAFRAELEQLMPLAVSALGICDPHVAFAVYEDAVRKNEESLTEGLEELAGSVESENRRQVGSGTGVGATPFEDPDACVGR